MNIDTLINAQWVIPVDPANNKSENNILEHHSIAINDGKILAILPTEKAQHKYSALKVHDLDKHAVMPGLINCHTHAAMNLFRGLADDLPLMEWLNEHIWPAEQEWISPEFVNDGTRHAIAEMIRGGTTCFNDMYFFPDQAAEVAVETGIRAVIGLILIDFPTAWAKDADEYLVKGEQVHDKYRHNSHIHTAFAPHAPYTVSDEPLQRINILAEELDIPIHMHVHETADEVKQSEEQFGKRSIQRLHELGLLSPRLTAVHMTQLIEEEIALLSAQGVHVVHCPESNLKLASGFCPVSELLQQGINVALGTDGAASNNDLDMFGEMRTAALLAKGSTSNSSALPAHQVLEMATINGAKALGIDHITGSLTKGKAADVIAIDLNTIESQPLYDPVSHLIYAASRNQVSDVWVAGKQLLRNRQLTSIDENLVLRKTSDWQEKISHGKIPES
ncbi:MAG: 5-methylthioadenosine/S-adenosylhomocysteine deaminase [Gammaproteobacteria bacterium]|jgi:5-methylthioadenosine/S-adenosylhomocysteine deaminase